MSNKFSGSVKRELFNEYYNWDFVCSYCKGKRIPIAYFDGEGWLVDLGCENNCIEANQSNEFLSKLLWPDSKETVYTKKELQVMGFVVLEG